MECSPVLAHLVLAKKPEAMKQIKLSFALILTFLSCADSRLNEPDSVEAILYKGRFSDQPLIVGLGGSEGGNAWASDRWKSTRDKFLEDGYAFLAIGYFGLKNTPEKLDRISLDNIYQAIRSAMDDPDVSDSLVAIVGGSKGAELALLMGSYYPDISCVVSIVGSHACFPALTLSASTSSWMYKEKEVPYVPASWASVPALLSRDLREAFTIMLKDSVAVEKALIEVENIKGPVLLLSATNDEMWPSTEMSELVIQRLNERKFPYPSEHVKIHGGHAEPLKHFDIVLNFLRKNFPANNKI